MEGKRKGRLNPAALLLYLFLLESEAPENKASVLLGIFICLFIYLKYIYFLLVRREETPNLSESCVKRRRKKKKNHRIPVTVPGLASHHSHDFPLCSLFTKSSTGVHS